MNSGIDLVYCNRKTRKEDLSDYTPIAKEQPALPHQVVGKAISGVCKSLMGFFKGSNSEALPYHLRTSCFYTRSQPYRKVPTRPLSEREWDNLKRIRKGFDPLEMTLTRWKKQDEEAKFQEEEERIEKDEMYKRWAEERKTQDEEEVPQPRKKFIKRYEFPNEEREKENWKLIDSKFEEYVNALKPVEIEEPSEKKDSDDTESIKTPEEEKPETIQAQSFEPQTTIAKSFSNEEEESAETSTQLTTPSFNPLPIPPEASAAEIKPHQSPNEIKQEETAPKVSNPFKEACKPLTLMDLMENSKSTFTFVNQQSQNEPSHSTNSQPNMIANPFQVSLQAITAQSKANTQNQAFSSTNFPFLSHSNPFNEGQNSQSKFPQSQSNFGSFQNNQTQGSNFSHQFHNTSLQQPQPQYFSQQGSNIFSNGISNPTMKNAAKSLFDSNPQASNQSPGSLFDVASTATNKTAKRSNGYNHKHGKGKNPVRIC